MPARSKPSPTEQSDEPAPTPTRIGVTLPPAVAQAVRRMDSDMGGDVGPAEVVRRGLILLDLYLSLEGNEELVVRNKDTEALERVRLAWDTF